MKRRRARRHQHISSKRNSTLTSSVLCAQLAVALLGQDNSSISHAFVLQGCRGIEQSSAFIESRRNFKGANGRQRSFHGNCVTLKCAVVLASVHGAGDDDSDIFSILSPRPDRDVDQIGPTQLAFVGDIVYELYVRSRYIWPARRTTDLQSIVVGIVRAETQSKLLASLVKLFPLTEKEQSILSRGRNASSGSRGRKRGKEWGAIYQDSTAFEALIGYIYISDKTRCFELLDWIRNEQDKIDEAQGLALASNRAEDSTFNSLLDLLLPRSDCNVDQIAPAQLAYVGDSVYELLARNRYVWPTRRTADLHTKVVSVSRAETQSQICTSLTTNNECIEERSGKPINLSAKELSVLSRGRNAAGGSGGRNKQVKEAGRKQDYGAGAAMHQDAAALETLLAYNFIADQKRCREILEWISREFDELD